MRTPSLAVAALAIFVGAGLAPALSVPTGSLTLTTEPGTAILWDGTLLGPTDDSGRMTISSIPPGSYSMTLRHEAFEELVRALNIEPGAQSLEVSLLKLPASAPADPPVPVAAAPTLPDPFAKQSTPMVSVTVVAFLVAIAVGALWLGRRRRFEPDEMIPPEPEGPRVMLANEPRGRRRPPGFYEDLRQRESVLEGLEDRGPDRPRPKVIDLPVVDHRPPEGDN
jgi:MYXO-CTERM domain-containing protein